MDDVDLEELLSEIFLSVFEWDELPGKQEIRKSSIEKWDSMAQLNLVSALESELDIVIELVDAKAIDSYASALEIVRKYDE